MRAQLTVCCRWTPMHFGYNPAGIRFAFTKNVMGKSVLIVDDNDHLRQILASILRFSGYQVSEAVSGIEAIDKAVLVKPSLILLDLSLIHI